MNNLFLFYLITINLIGFISIYSDKRKAIHNQWRIKESTLLSIALIGGSLGSLIGMYKFRHKTKHIKFTIGVPFIILCQILIFLV